MPQRLHETVIAATQAPRLIGHITRDSTAIQGGRFPETAKQRAANWREAERKKK